MGTASVNCVAAQPGNHREIVPYNLIVIHRGVAQFGRALRSGRRGRRFKSCRLDHKSTNFDKRFVDFLLPCFSAFNMLYLPKESDKWEFVSDLLFQLNQITFDIKSTSPYQHYDEVLLRYCRCLSPHSHIWSRIGMRDFPRSVKLYSTFGGICGYSSR